MIALLIALFVSLVISVVTAALFGPKPIYGSQLKNKAISSSTYGLPWPRCRGKVRLPGNMIWSTPIKQANRKTTSGGIFGIGQQSVYTFRYSVSCAVGFGYKLGASDGIGRVMTIYVDGKVLYTAKVTDAGVGGTVTLASSGGTTQYGAQTVPTAAIGDQVITLQTGSGGSLNLSAGDMIQLTYYVVTEVDDNNDTQQVIWNAAAGISGGTFASLDLSIEMNTQEYEVQAPITLGPNQSGQVQIYPALIDNYPAGATLMVPGLTTPLLDESSFDPDPHDGSHAAAGGYYPKNGYINFYYGSPTQEPDPLIVAAKGAGNVPAYRGLVYVVISDLELANFGNRIPNFSAEIDFETPAGDTDSTAGEILGVQMTDYGQGYIRPPNVSFNGDGTGARGTAIMGGLDHVLNVEMTSNGSGYTTASVTFTANGDEGSGAAGNPILNPGSPTQGITTSQLMLSDIVSSILTEAGYSAAQYDVTALALTPVQGIELLQEPYRDSLQRLMGIYLFDSAEIDGQIVFSFRDGLPSIEIPESDLGALADMESNEPRIVEMLQDEQSVPFFVWLRYYDSLKQYQQASQYAKRVSQPFASDLLDALPVVNSRDSITLDVPITEIGTTMKQQAEKILYDLWSSRTTAKFKLGYKYAQLDPTDIIEVAYKGDFLVIRLITVNLGSSFALECEGVSHDYHHSVALSTGGTPRPPGGTLPGSGLPSPSNMFLLDIPFIDDRDSHDLEDTGMYFALSTLLNLKASSNTLAVNWHGGKVYRSVDQAATDFASVGTNSTPAFSGTATTLLPAPINPIPANFSADTVTIAWTGYDASLKIGPSQPLMSSTDDGVTNNHENLAALIKTNGEVELFQFVNATDNGDGTFTLSRLVRGVRGTETMAKGHAIGDAFVLLSGVSGLTDSTHFDVPLGDRNLTRYYQAVSDGATADFSAPTQKTTICRDLMPYAPWQIYRYNDPLGNLVITWQRRSRIGGNWADGTDGPISEQYEQYDLDIQGPGGTVLRTKTTAQPTVIYTVSEQTADFGATIDPTAFSVTIYQVSAIVGRGFPGSQPALGGTPGFGGEPYAISYDMGPGISPNPGELMHEHAIAGNVSGVVFPKGLNDSVAYCRTAPDTDYAITINWRNGPIADPVYVATLTYKAGETTGTFAFNEFMGGHDFIVASGQIVEFVAPDTIDEGISGIYFTASGRRYYSEPGTIGVPLTEPLA